MSLMHGENVRKYAVKVSHPTNFHSGRHVLTVRDTVGRPAGTVYVSGADFGCSRDYFVKSDIEAVKLFMSEHACSVLCCHMVKA